MADLFGGSVGHHKDIWKHIQGRRVRSRGSSCKKCTTAEDGKTYQVESYNLDAIISVGYRVNSKRGTQFRIWATRTLREHLLHGYTLNERRLREKGLGEMEEAVGLLARTLERHELVTDEGRAVLEVVERYTRAWRLLLEYDERRLSERLLVRGGRAGPSTWAVLGPPSASCGPPSPRGASRPGLFGQERGDQLEAILGNVEQTFGGEPLYPSVQVRAAHLLYFLIKDHPFADGNKRIGTLLFLEYLRRNGMLARADGSPHSATTRSLRSPFCRRERAEAEGPDDQAHPEPARGRGRMSDYGVTESRHFLVESVRPGLRGHRMRDRVSRKRWRSCSVCSVDLGPAPFARPPIPSKNTQGTE